MDLPSAINCKIKTGQRITQKLCHLNTSYMYQSRRYSHVTLVSRCLSWQLSTDLDMDVYYQVNYQIPDSTCLDSIKGLKHGRTYAVILVSTKFLGCIDNQTFLLIKLRLKSHCSLIFLNTNIINSFRRNDNVLFARDNLRSSLCHVL